MIGTLRDVRGVLCHSRIPKLVTRCFSSEFVGLFACLSVPIGQLTLIANRVRDRRKMTFFEPVCLHKMELSQRITVTNGHVSRIGGLL